MLARSYSNVLMAAHSSEQGTEQIYNVDCEIAKLNNNLLSNVYLSKLKIVLDFPRAHQ